MTAVPRYHTPRRRRRKTRGGELAAVAADMGMELMPWQRLAVDVALEWRSTDIPYYDTVFMSVERQTGKSALVRALAAWWAEAFSQRQVIIATAQTRKVAARRMFDLARDLERFGHPMKTTRSIGSEAITWPNSSELLVMSPNAEGGHSETVDLGLIDEAWAVDMSVTEGIVPAMSTNKRSQLWVISTAGTLESEMYLHYLKLGVDSLTERGTRTCIIHYGMTEQDDPYDEDVWKRTNPALGHTIDIESIRTAARTLTQSGFIRAYGNLTVIGRMSAVPIEWWDNTTIPNVPITDAGADLILGVDVNLGPSSASITSVWERNGTAHIELEDYRPGGELGWVTRRIDDLISRYRIDAVAIDPAGPAAAITSELREICETNGVVFRMLTGRELGGGAQQFYAGLRDAELTHGPMPALDLAIDGAQRKNYGDLWIWSRRDSANDVSPLIAATAAIYTLDERRHLFGAGGVH